MFKFFDKISLIEKIIILIIFLIILINFSSSVINLYEKRFKIYNYFFTKSNELSNNSKYNKLNDDDVKWSNKILNGGYILHFRHAERDKWTDVQKYDALESHLHDNGIESSRFAEKDYFADAVCLNKRGKIQAKAMGEHIKHVNLPIGYVVSSPSCRARQTAELAFGGYDDMNVVLVHYGPYNESRHEHANNLSVYYRNLPLEKGKNTIVSGHNSTIHKDMFDNNLLKLNLKKDLNSLTLEEGGFFVISREGIGKDSKLNLIYQFHNFRFFTKNFYKR